MQALALTGVLDTFYVADGNKPAADTTFVQFYPTIMPAAANLKTLSAAYLAETAK